MHLLLDGKSLEERLEGDLLSGVNERRRKACTIYDRRCMIGVYWIWNGCIGTGRW